MQKCYNITVTGKVQDIRKFFQEIRTEGEQRGAVIKDIQKREIPFDIDLPDVFSKVTTDDDVDIGRKLDKGNELLTDIKGDTSAIKTGIDALNVKFDIFIREQGEHN